MGPVDNLVIYDDRGGLRYYENVSYFRGGFIPKKLIGPSPGFEMLDYGFLTYPDVNFYFYKDGEEYWVGNCGLRGYNISCNKYECSIQETVDTIFSLPSQKFTGYLTWHDNEPSEPVYTSVLKFNKKGYIKTNVPSIRYRFVCNYNGPGVGEFAYAEFTIEPNKEVKVTPSMLVKGENIEEKYFNDFIIELEEECN